MRDRSRRVDMWERFIDVGAGVATSLLAVNLANKKALPIPWWIVIVVCGLDLMALAMWLHDAGHVTFVARRVDARRQRKADVEAAVHQAEAARLEAETARVRAIAQEKADQEAEVDRWIWLTDHYPAQTTNGEWTVAVVCKPPRGLDPRDHPEWAGSCVIRYGEIEHRSEERPSRNTLGVQFAFPHDFRPLLGWPLPPGAYEVVWGLAAGSLSTRDAFVIDEFGRPGG